MTNPIAITAANATHKILPLEPFIFRPLSFLDLHPTLRAAILTDGQVVVTARTFWDFRARWEVVRVNFFRSGVSKR
jgi:hypothetical protein